MEALLRWRHLAPTAPDTLAAIPLSEADPFILAASPAVFFVGCQPSYGTRLVEGDMRVWHGMLHGATLRTFYGRVTPSLDVGVLNHTCAFCAGPDGQKVRLIAVPEFRKTGVALLVDLDTLEPQPLHFDACLS
jgi:DNA polymerase II small subunit/DNA polymerase delta subunit B